MSNKAFIIIDVQNDFCEGGALGVEGGSRVAENISNFLDYHAHEFDYVMTTQDWHISPGEHWSKTPDFVDTWPVHCAANSIGADFNPNLNRALSTHKPIERFFKGRYDAAYSGFEAANISGIKLPEFLRDKEIEEITVVGLATDYCVNATVLDAVKAGFKVNVISDSIAGINPEKVEESIQNWKNLGVNIT